MLNLYVYNHNRTSAERFSEKCISYINSAGLRIKTRCTHDVETISGIVALLDDAALFMLKKDGSLEEINDVINLSDKNNYIVLVFREAEEMFDAVTPKLRPSGLILENSDVKRIGKIIDEIYADYIRCRTEDGTDYHFRIKGVEYSASFSSVVLIEVQSKKIKFHTSAQTYEFYDSLDSVMKEAPDYFVRIHRSYVINARFIKEVNFREKIIILKDESTVFFSRNYLHELKEYFYKTVKEDVI